MATSKFSLLQRTVNTLVDLHGGIRPASRKLDIHAPTLTRIRQGEVTDPEDETLRKLGLERIEGVELHRRRK